LRPIEPSPDSIGCKWCVRGHAPTWQHSPLPGQWVHVIQEKSKDLKTTSVAVTICTAALNQEEKTRG